MGSGWLIPGFLFFLWLSFLASFLPPSLSFPFLLSALAFSFVCFVPALVPAVLCGFSLLLACCSPSSPFFLPSLRLYGRVTGIKNSCVFGVGFAVAAFAAVFGPFFGVGALTIGGIPPVWSHEGVPVGTLGTLVLLRQEAEGGPFSSSSFSF